ncbi:hypothetical protein F5144DRAFT_487652 [Chaetomium tenue]|uniref:Uncharacterized protein n=4 Tax=Chaetomium tenue TaxID=1854479 RepID=A0ACB7P2L3_9PEZI|nr:hypothetical protein F5144DRAFT_499733 [Chaetomium globosum]KAH6628089.1 hypothetical protein F5144DRAFT_494748 [Chaetomium globosum]KAH6632496.1 hypothetical protein F5144DRAFT_489295 [Chaetomium globosum]KAH6635791.1 hypothetical protein F5144DRAFT_487652 [Chaetomium globosum]
MANFFGDGADGLGPSLLDPTLRNETQIIPNTVHIVPSYSACVSTERERILASKSSMDVRRVRKRPAPPRLSNADDDGDDDDEAAAAEVAEDDARGRKLTSVSLWQIFLYHTRRPEKDEEYIKSIYGESVDPHGLEWANARQHFLDDQKNCKFRVIHNMEHAQQPEYTLLLDTRVDVSRQVLTPLAHAAWSSENWTKVWTYMVGRVDYDGSHVLGQYYMRTMFQGLAVEVAVYLRVKAKDEDLALARRQELLEFYDDMTKKRRK